MLVLSSSSQYDSPTKRENKKSRKCSISSNCQNSILLFLKKSFTFPRYIAFVSSVNLLWGMLEIKLKSSNNMARFRICCDPSAVSCSVFVLYNGWSCNWFWNSLNLPTWTNWHRFPKKTLFCPMIIETHSLTASVWSYTLISNHLVLSFSKIYILWFSRW